MHRDALVRPANAVGLLLDLFQDLFEVGEPFARQVGEFTILLGVIEEVEHQWSTSHNIRTARQKFLTDLWVSDAM